MVGFLFGFVLMLAFVVNVGLWIQAQRRTQSVADAVALAIAPGAPASGCNGATSVEAVADCYADLNWSRFSNGGSVTVDASAPSSYTVHATHSVPGLFTGIVGTVFGSVTVSAKATSAVQAPATLNNAELTALQPTPTHVAPLVVRQDACGSPPWDAACFSAGSPIPLTLDENDPSDSAIGIADLSCAVSCGPAPDATTLANWIACTSCLAGDIGTNVGLPVVPVSVLDTCPGRGRRGRGNPQCPIRNALAAAEGKTLLVPVFDGVSGGAYQVVGFAALTVTDVPNNRQWRDSRNKTISVRFSSFTPKAGLDTSGAAPAFGVQVFGLTG
jgi:hypothetical protein